ncbi:hypothetical protein F0562_014456 [Nyssa sinensis]|uniref:Uncharacterized protein n=1 Tax=Nyssa sinensis TaxID=561372 RepID=A0A5J4ZNR3_9ASTE|nr:hypothetical protein F0562_014456 [Nyssa sinensis]
MAEAVISGLVEVILRKTVSQILEEYGLLYGTKKEMRNLQSILSTIQAVLEDAEHRQVTEKAVRNWLMKLKDAAYDADDFLDEYMIEALRYKEIHDNMETQGCIFDEVSHFFSQSNPIFCYKMGCKLKEIGEKLDAISSERKLPEEIGSEYFNELLWRSFFQNVTKDSDGNIMECKMHDLVHDLAKSVAGIDCCTVELGSQVIKTGTRHLSMVCNERVLEIPKALKNAHKVRSFLLLFGRQKIKRVCRPFILSLKSVHALDLSGTGIKKLSKSIGTLKHLRYLNLSDAPIKKLPKSICDLLYLQTLILMHCNRLEKLPGDIRKLVNLRHLNIYGCRSLTRLPHGIGKLRSLQTLPIFIVGKDPAHNIAELQSLDLHGELEIKNLENVHDARCAKDANLKEKRNLQSLRLNWEQVDEVNARENVECVVESLKPNSELKKLHIENYMGVKFPSWLMNLSLSNIVELSLIKCQRCFQLPLLGKLPALEVLTLDGMDAVVYFCNDSAGNSGINNFASLKQLSLKNMDNFLGWSIVEGSDTLPCLKKLICEGCPKLFQLPNIPSIESLEMNDCSIDLLKAVTEVKSLSNLIIREFLELIYLPQGLLRNNTHLLSLEIRDCPKLRFLSGELTSLCALQSLSISNCDELESWSELGSLKSLKSLSIFGCHSLIIFPEEGIGSLRSLQHFWLSDCDNLTALPEAMQHLSGLQTLHICSCFKLDTLPEWLGNLVSLQELEIWYCENICRLPASMQRLTSLQFLSIWGCPRLEIGCKKETGEDWHKIQHVPFIKINGPYIQVMNG